MTAAEFAIVARGRAAGAAVALEGGDPVLGARLLVQASADLRAAIAELERRALAENFDATLSTALDVLAGAS